MRRSNVQRQSDRRADILAAARRCFARSGFHQASMQEICNEAGMSPGNVYRYFPSKEAIIAGIAENDRADVMEKFAAMAQAPDFFSGLESLARYHLVERPDEEFALCAEIMAESRRNPEVARIYQQVEDAVRERLIAALQRAAETGEIAAPANGFNEVVTIMTALADGLCWRRAVDPGFDPQTVLGTVLATVRCLLRVQGAARTAGGELQ